MATAPTAPTTRALVTLPASAQAGVPFELRALVQHPMETGYRPNSEGQLLPRDLIRRIEYRFDGELVFEAELHAAIAANPYLAVWLKLPRSGELEIRWSGDGGFSHRELRRLVVT